MLNRTSWDSLCTRGSHFELSTDQKLWILKCAKLLHAEYPISRQRIVDVRSILTSAHVLASLHRSHNRVATQTSSIASRAASMWARWVAMTTRGALLKTCNIRPYCTARWGYLRKTRGVTSRNTQWRTMPALWVFSMVECQRWKCRDGQCALYSIR